MPASYSIDSASPNDQVLDPCGSTLAPGEDRLRDLQARHDTTAVCLADVLCDAHPPAAIALTIVAPDLATRDVTYGELRDRSKRFAAALADLGVEPGDRVATLMGKSVDLVIALLGIWRRGAVHVPLFTAFAPPAIELRLTASAAKAVVVDQSQRDKLDSANAVWTIITTGDRVPDGDISFEELLQRPGAGIPSETVAGEDPFIMVFTSGTTGLPKGVLTPVRAIAGMQLYLEYGLDLDPDDVYWNAADPGWAYGLFYAIVAPLAAGHRTILASAPFDPALTWRIIKELRVTNFAAAPTVYRALRATGPDIAQAGDLALRCLSSAGEPLDPDTLRWGSERLGAPIRDHYGQTELGMMIANAWHPDIRRPIKPGSMGTPLPGWTAQVLREDRDEIAPVGQLGRVAIDILHSPAMPFIGYHDAPDRTAERLSADGRWYLTGDTASRDHDGYFTFSSRDDDVIIMAGYRIGPFEIESVLCQHAEVTEAAVIGVPDELRGEVIEAFIVLEPDAQQSNNLAADLQQHVKIGFAAHAYPRVIHFIDTLPRTPSGKVQRYLLRDRRRTELQETHPSGGD